MSCHNMSSQMLCCVVLCCVVLCCVVLHVTGISSLVCCVQALSLVPLQHIDIVAVFIPNTRDASAPDLNVCAIVTIWDSNNN